MHDMAKKGAKFLISTQSPTFTEEDRLAADELALICETDPLIYGLEMLKAGTDLSGKSLEDLIALDAKEFMIDEIKIEIAQVNAVDVESVMSQQGELEDLIYRVIAEKGLGLFLFVVTDIINNDSTFLALGKEAERASSAFNVVLLNNRGMLKGIVSRKMQIVPVLTEALK